MSNLTVTEFKDIRVLTTQQLAESYETTDKVISNNFNNNKSRYQEGKHYILLRGEELRKFLHSSNLGLQNTSKIRMLYLWTEKGAFLHAKSLNTDKAWEVYDHLVDTYFRAKKQLSHMEIMRIQLGMIDDHEVRIDKLENTMTIDYGQQQVIKKKVNARVVDWLGGKDSNAYKEISKKVFSECNRDIQDYFSVNSRNNIPKLRFEDAISYIKNWGPSTNTRMMIRDTNAQMIMEGSY